MPKDKPEIRFAGYTDAWEKRKLGSMGTTYSGLSGKTKEDFGHGNAKFVTYMNVFSNPLSQLEGLDSIEIDEKQHQVKKGDVFFTTSSETPNEVGMSSVWTFNIPNVYLNSFTFAYRPTEVFDLNYLAFVLRSPLVRRSFMLLAQGISRFNISKVKAMDITIPVPEFKEQEKIGSLLGSLDNLITVNQRKVDLLKELKKGFLQKMFPKTGEDKPEIRFAGYTDVWEKRKLSSQYKKITEKNDLSFKTNKIISVANMYYKSDSAKSDDNYMKTYNVFRIGDIAFEGHKSNSYAYGRFVENTIGDGIVSHIFDVFRPIRDYDLQYWKYAIQYEPIMGRLLMKSTTKSTMMNNLVAKDFLKKELRIPKLNEQQKIGGLFQKLDKLITVNQRRVDLLKQEKKALLQKMFV